MLYVTLHCSHSDSHSFPTRRSSDLLRPIGMDGRRLAAAPAIGAVALVEAEIVRLPDQQANHLDLFPVILDRKSTRLNSSHLVISYAVFCLKKKKYSSRVDT